MFNRWGQDMTAISAAFNNTISADEERHTSMKGDTTLTPTEQRIFLLLEDGDGFTSQQILEQAIGKRFASKHLVPTNINRMRGKLAGQWSIVCEGGFYVMKAVEHARAS